MISITKTKMNTTITLTDESIREFLYDYEKDIDTKWVDLEQIVIYVKRNLPETINNNDFYNFVADYCVSKTSYHPDYNTLASRICVDRLHKSTTEDILDVVEILYNNTDIDGVHHPLVSENLLNTVKRFYKKIKDVIHMERDYLFDYFGIRTLERSYLLKIHKDKTKQIIERPQHMIMRVALGIHGANIDAAIETYELISQRYFTHATPTLFNAGRTKQQFSSCFVKNTEIFTINDGVKNIQDVKIGDKVVTHTGKIQKVLQLHKNLLNDRKIYKLKVSKTKEIYVTGNHKFLSSINKNTSNWNAIEDLRVDNYIAIPNYKGNDEMITIDISNYLKNTKSLTYNINKNTVISTINTEHSTLTSMEVSRFWKIDNDFAKLIGIFLGNGNIIIKKNTAGDSIINGINFALYSLNIKGIHFIKKVGKYVFGINPTINKIKDHDIVQVMFHSNIIGIIFNTWFGQMITKKNLPNFIFTLSTNILYSLMAGLITTNSRMSKDSNIIVHLSDKLLTKQLYHLYRNRGIDIEINELSQSSYNLHIPKIQEILEQTLICFNKNMYKSCFNKNMYIACFNKLKINVKSKSSPITINNHNFLRIESLEKTNMKEEWVYTLGVENDHSYNVEGLVCENCFLLGIDDDLDNIFSQIKQMALISKWAGGLGVHMSGIRAKGSVIRGTNGISDGIIPLAIMINKLSKYVNQGGNRPGSVACYLEPYHADIFEFCELRKTTSGNDDNRARDLYLALWIPDIFMKRVEEDGMWSLMCPDTCPHLATTHGEEFEKLYISYENAGKYKKQVKARHLWKHIIECQMETGFPYMLYKDHANLKSNQKNLGTIRSSNLCVSGDTKILIKQLNDTVQYVLIKDYKDMYCTVWNGYEWSSSVEIKQTGIDQPLMEITFNICGKYLTEVLKCTEYHKFYILDNGKEKEVRGCELKIGDKLVNYYVPLINNNLVENLYNSEVIVIDIKYNVSIENTYCYTEPLRNRGFFNNICTGQCAEIIQYSDGNTIAVCNLASLCLPKYVIRDPDMNTVLYDYNKLIEVVRVIIRNLNKIIDRNYYPTESTRESNIKMRPVGLGVQGLVDVYNAFNYAYDSDHAQYLNKKIFETIYFAALDESKELAKTYGAYSMFKGSPFSEGKLQFHLWGMSTKDLVTKDMYDWDTLVEEIKVYGTRNSLLTALMPTAGTSQIMKCYESFEPYLSNLFVRTTMAGEFIVINEKLIYDLIKEGLWNDDMRKLIIIKNGSIQTIDSIPKYIKDIYKTAFEISLKSIISQSADRAPFVDQSQSINLFMAKPDFTILTSAHFYGWKRGLKTGMYYLRTTSAVNPIQFGIDITDVMRLTGTTNAIELMTSDYNIRLSDSDKYNKKDKKNDDEKDDEFTECPIDPEERKMCLSCSS